MRKIIYLIEQPLDGRNYDRYGIQAWIDRHWLVEVWDVTPLAYPDVWRDFAVSGRPLKRFEGYFPIETKRELKQRFDALAAVGHFIDFTGEEYVSLRVKAALCGRGAKRVICAPGSIPVPELDRTRSFGAKLRAILAKGPIRTWRALGMAVLRKLAAPLIRPGLVVAAGEVSIAAAGAKSEVLKVHSFDYDVYLRVRNAAGSLPEGRAGDAAASAPKGYAVFVDQDLCFHPDFVRQGIPFVVTPAKYFPSLCAGLRRIAHALDLDVRIAAHPRASYLKRGIDYFEGFDVRQGGTAELIRDCRAVVCHDSTAIHFAVLFDKPMIFFTTDELVPSFEGRSIAQAAAELGKSPINLDRDLLQVDWHREIGMDAAKYRAYRNKFIKIDGTPERPMWDVIIDHIERAQADEYSKFSSSFEVSP